MAKPYDGMSAAALNPDQGITVALPEGLHDVAIELESMDEEITIDPETGEIIGMEMEAEGELVPMHDANLAEFMDPEELDRIGEEIVSMVASDNQSREPWYKRLREGLKNLGIYDLFDINETIDAVALNHPMLIEAATQFQARAMAELLPATGPVKAGVFGDYTEDTLEQGRRVEMFMNYQLTVEDRTYYDERDKMLFRLPFTGSEFDKQYYCPVKKRVVSRWVKFENFVVPYGACSLEDAPRYTHVIPDMTHNQYKKLVAAGFYRDVGLDAPGDDTPAGEQAELQKAFDSMEGVDKPAVQVESDKTHTFYECHIDRDLPGFEDADGIARPYIITVDKETQQVLSIYRNWREADETKAKRVWFSHKYMLPGFGFYGFGLIHTIGGMSETASRLLNILLDSGAFATLQGGFKSRDAKMKGDVILEPGVWKDTELTAEELSRAFYTPPFKEPSQALFALLGSIVEGGQRFAATTETMVGDAATTGPVGSMVAQIEQGSKVFSGIHKRLHKAFGDEFIHIAELNGENLPEVYPYYVRGTGQTVLRADFDGRVDIVPVSDPNIFSSAQRLAIAQTSLQLAGQMPDLFDRRAAAEEVLAAIRHPNPSRVLPPPQMAETGDPITEAQLVLMGRAIKAEMWQNHQAHNMVHMLSLQSLPPQLQPLMQAHMQEHEAMNLRVQMQMQLGIPLPELNYRAERGEPMAPQLPPEMENEIAMRAAQMAQQVMAQQQAQQQAQMAQQDQQGQMQQAAQQMQQMQAKMQQLAQENAGLKQGIAQMEGAADAQVENLRNQGKQIDIAKEQLKIRGKAIDLAKQQIQDVQKRNK